MMRRRRIRRRVLRGSLVIGGEVVQEEETIQEFGRVITRLRVIIFDIVDHY